MLISVSLFWHVLRSGTEEEYTELAQLLEDISTYMNDVVEMKAKNKQEKRKKERDDKIKAEYMRKAAMEGMASRLCMLHTLVTVVG